MNILELTASSILEDSVFDELFSEPNEVQRAKLTIELSSRAKALGSKAEFDAILNARKSMERQQRIEEKRAADEEKALAKAERDRANEEARERQRIAAAERNIMQLHAMTDFQSDEYPELFCGAWVCNANGIRALDRFGEIVACYHPILPVQRLVNIETHTEKMLIAYNKDGKWREQIFDKPTLLSASKITGALTQFGILLSSENAKHLVRYFVEVESMNVHSIPMQLSTSKMGWVNGTGKFMPYVDDKSVVFDSESSFQSLFASISTSGSRDKYIEFLKRLRKKSRKEPIFCMAASLASVLVKPCGTLPFIFHLYGEGGKGKTVTLMLATGIWGSPNENGYMADPKSTRTAFEMRLNFLNHLPFICDDTAQMKKFVNAQKNGDFADFIYLVCSGKGNERSNVSLGLNAMTTWRNTTITSGEKPLTTEVSQGGEILRVIEYPLEPGEVFENSRGTAEFIRANYGFIGREFIEAIQRIGMDEVKSMYSNFVECLHIMDSDGEKEGKQINSFALLLTADKILADEIMHDDVYLDIEDCFNMAATTAHMSDNERAYEFIMNEVRLNIRSFANWAGDTPPQRWGYINNGYVLINPNVFSGFCERGNFNKKLFMTWALANDKAICEAGRFTKTVFGKGKFIHIKLDSDINAND